MIECQHPQFSLSGQVALITGAGSPTGIGFATAIALLAMPGASYITGQRVVVDGGNCLQERKG